MTTQTTGILVFNASPSCADVYIDNILLGKTSLKVNNVTPNKYNYKLKSGKTEYTNSILARAGKVITIFINLITGEKKESVSDIPEDKSSTPIVKPPTQPPTQTEDNYGFGNDKPILIDNPLTDTPISTSKHLDYYDVASTIKVAGLTDPDDFDSPVYNKEEIFKIKGRYSERITIKNDGFVPLYVIVAHGTSRTSFSKEVPIYSGEIKTYYNVYEFRLRSSIAGHEYRVMEYDLQFSIEKSTLPITLSTSSTNAATGFVGALAMNFIETIHVPGLSGNKMKILAINGQSVQALKYRLIFWSSVTANTTNIDTDKYVTDVVMDFTDNLSTFQIDTGGGLVNQYYLDVSDLLALYTDDDQTVTLHVSLQNLSPVAKIAGALGAVQFDFKYVMTV